MIRVSDVHRPRFKNKARARDVIGRICTPDSSILHVSTDKLAEFVVNIAEQLSGEKFYPYQRIPALRFARAVLNREPITITVCMARQMGKSTVIAATVLALIILLPWLANHPAFAQDWRFNLTDEQGRYRGFKNGISVGIYAPKQDLAQIIFDKLTMFLALPGSEAILEELGIGKDTWRGNTVILSNGSKVLALTANDKAKIEGSTHHIVVLDEAQDISQKKIRKSISPMTAATKGLMVMVGTASISKGEFFYSIKYNRKNEAVTGEKNHFEYNWKVGARYNSLYRDKVIQERAKYGADSDEFRMAYMCQWLLERGMFTTVTILKSSKTLVPDGPFSLLSWGSPDRSQVAGIDFGKVNDSTVVTVVEVDWEDPSISHYADNFESSVSFTAFTKYLLNWLEIRGDDYESQYGDIVKFLGRFPKMEKLVLDSTSLGSPMVDRFRASLGGEMEVEAFPFSTVHKSEGYKVLSTDIVAGRIRLPFSYSARREPLFQRFAAQLLDLQKSYTVGNLLVCRAPEEAGAHDDFPDSLMMANWGANTRAVSSQIEVLSGNIFAR